MPICPFCTNLCYANYSWFGSFMQQMETVMHMKSRWQLRDDCPFLAQHSVVRAACPRASTCTKWFGYVGNSWRIWRSGKHRTTRDPSYRLECQTWQKGIAASKDWTCTGSLYHVNSQHVNLSTFSLGVLCLLKFNAQQRLEQTLLWHAVSLIGSIQDGTSPVASGAVPVAKAR